MEEKTIDDVGGPYLDNAVHAWLRIDGTPAALTAAGIQARKMLDEAKRLYLATAADKRARDDLVLACGNVCISCERAVCTLGQEEDA